MATDDVPPPENAPNADFERSFPHLRVRRPSLWLLLIPALAFLLTPIVANRVEPVVLGMPFIIFYSVICIVLTWLALWVASRLDPIYRNNAVEPVPADDVGTPPGAPARPQPPASPPAAPRTAAGASEPEARS